MHVAFVELLAASRDLPAAAAAAPIPPLKSLMANVAPLQISRDWHQPRPGEVPPCCWLCHSSAGKRPPENVRPSGRRPVQATPHQVCTAAMTRAPQPKPQSRRRPCCARMGRGAWFSTNNRGSSVHPRRSHPLDGLPPPCTRRPRQHAPLTTGTHLASPGRGTATDRRC